MAVAREDIETYKTLMRAGEPEKALSHLKRLLLTHHDDQGLLAVMAPLALRLGDKTAAIDAYQSLLSAANLRAADFFNIGYALKVLGHFKYALSAYERALETGLSQPEDAYQNMGVIFADELHDLPAAEAAFRQAISLNPSIIGPYINLGNIFEETGQFRKAAEVYEAATQNVDNAFEAMARLSNAHEYETNEDPLLATIENALLSSAASDFDKECLHFALGTAFDKLGKYGRAWTHFTQANAHGKAHGRPYDAKGMEIFVDDIISQYSAVLSEFTAPDKEHSPIPIFICGMFRSGSTLTEQILSAHPDFTPLGECPFIPETAQKTPKFYPSQSAKLDIETRQTLRNEYYHQNAVNAVKTPFFTDKRPDNFLYIGLIKQIFPKAKIVFTDRNPKDNFLSIYFTQFGNGQAYARDFEAISHYNVQHQRLISHWKTLFEADSIFVNYDTLIANPEKQVRRLLSDLGAQWDPACLSFHKQNNRVKTASYKQVRRPFYRSSSGRWKHYEKWAPQFES